MVTQERNTLGWVFDDIPWPFPLAGVVAFMCSLDHHPTYAAILGGLLLAFVVLTYSRWTLRLMILVVLGAAVHDLVTGQLH